MALVRDRLVLNDRKQQALGLNRAVRRACQGAGGIELTIAEYQGVSRYGYRDPHLEIEKKIADQQSVARRARCTGGSQEARCNTAGTLLFESCVYGAECQYMTDKQFARMRSAMCTAMGDADGRRADSVTQRWCG